jgi:hypothetical protein
MDTFEKILSEKLKETQNFEFCETDWQEVSDRLDMHAPVATSTWKKVFVPLIMTGLLGAVGVLWWQLNQTNGELQELKKDLFENTLMQRDTVIQTVVYRDTIFAAASQSSNINTHDISWVGKPGSGVVNPFLSLGDNLAKTINQSFSNHTFLWESLSTSTSTWGVSSKSEGNFALERLRNIPNNLPKLSINSISTEQSEEVIHAKNSPIVIDPHFQLLGAQIGLTVGKSFITNNQLAAVSSTNIGLKAEFLFVKNLSIVAGLDFYNLSYQTQSDFLGKEVPLPEDPIYLADDLLFTESNQNFTQLKLGFKYTFGNESNIKPYVGLNYLATANFKKDFYYLYDPAKYAIPSFETSSKNTDITGNGFGIDLGVEYRPKNWLSIQFETYYHISNRKLESLYHDLLGVRTAALFRF